MTTRILSGPATVAGLRKGRLIIMHALVTVDSLVAMGGLARIRLADWDCRGSGPVSVK